MKYISDASEWISKRNRFGNKCIFCLLLVYLAVCAHSMLSISLDYNLFGTIFLELVSTKSALSTVSCLLFAMWLQNVG